MSDVPPEPSAAPGKRGRRATPPAKPEYDFLVSARASRHFGWRLLRTGMAARPSATATERYMKQLAQRLGVERALLREGLPADPLVRRALRAYVEAVHGRIAWYESSLAWKAFTAVFVRGALLTGAVLATGYVFVLAGTDEGALAGDALGLVQTVVAGIAALAALGKLFSASGARPEVEAWIAALAELKRALFAFESAWDDAFVEDVPEWPEGFAGALWGAVDEADAIEEAERRVSLLAAVGAVGDAAALLQELQGTVSERGAARQGALARALSPIQQARVDVQSALHAERRAAGEPWADEAMLLGYRQTRLDAELRLEKLLAEDRMLRTGE